MDQKTEDIEAILESVRTENRHKEIMKFLEDNQSKKKRSKTLAGVVFVIVILGVLMLWETNLAVTQMP